MVNVDFEESLAGFGAAAGAWAGAWVGAGAMVSFEWQCGQELRPVSINSAQ
jgi:hypothetical protein